MATDSSSESPLVTLSIDIHFPTEADATTVEHSIRPEVDDLQDDRSWTVVERTGGLITIDITATDLVALRASMNTWLGFIDVALAVMGSEDILKPSGSSQN